MVCDFFTFDIPSEKSELKTILINLLAFAFLIYIANYLWQRRWLYYYGSQVPGPFAWPLLGNALEFVGETDDIFEKFSLFLKKYKPIGRLWLGNRIFFGITKPEYMEIVLNNALDKHAGYNLLQYAVGNGLLTAPVAVWKTNRKMITPTFNQKILNGFVETFAKQSKILIEILSEQANNFDVVPFIQRCTLDIISETAMGEKIQAQTGNNEYVRWINRGMEILYMRIFRIWLHPNFIWKLSPLCKEVDDILTNSKAIIRKSIEDRKQEYLKKIEQEEEDVEGTRRMKTFAECMAEGAITSNWDPEQIVNEVLTMTVAGTDTSANGIGFTLIMLGMNPEIQELVLKEQREIFNESLDDVVFEDLPKMQYLERVVKETLRLFPIGPTFSRQVNEDLNLGRYVIPKGAACIIAPIIVHRDPQYWPDPLRFDPDRFLPENVKKRHPYTFIPFSAGPRNCIGLNYAMMSMKAMLSTIVRHFKITTQYKNIEDVKIKTDITLKCVNGYNITLQKRIK